jgi:hypothetical protein
MHIPVMSVRAPSDPELCKSCSEYSWDVIQRSILFWDVMRKRGNIFLKDTTWKSVVAAFDHEIILDGREFPRPVNYSLARIIPKKGFPVDPSKRPIVVTDPRVGQGPGIRGSRLDSEIVIAMKKGHAVYFLVFHSEPVPGQSIGDVELAETKFVAAVAKLHPDSEEPAVIGNCADGWAAALLGVSRPDVTGPLFLNVSPLSYWGGPVATDQMRFEGALAGGVWLSRFLCDLNNGVIDGANLMANFERLNLTDTLWSRPYQAYSEVDTAEAKYLACEQWWHSYFVRCAEEMHFIVRRVAVDDNQDKGRLQLDRGRILDLRNTEEPVVLFASTGDGNTSPAHVLNWVRQVYRSTREIKRLGKVIVFRWDQSIGHLGVFVSGRTERAKAGVSTESLAAVECLPPGLYEMVIDEGEKIEGVSDYAVSYAQRTMADIEALLGPNLDDTECELERVISDSNDRIYRYFVGPWIRMLVNEVTAEVMRLCHPERLSRYVCSDMNPFLLPIKLWAPLVKRNRIPASPDNPFLILERKHAETVEKMLRDIQDMRDGAQNFWFEAVFRNPILEWLLTGRTHKKASADGHPITRV